jgi:hypothetical protein
MSAAVAPVLEGGVAITAAAIGGAAITAVASIRAVLPLAAVGPLAAIAIGRRSRLRLRRSARAHRRLASSGLAAIGAAVVSEVRRSGGCSRVARVSLIHAHWRSGGCFCRSGPFGARRGFWRAVWRAVWRSLDHAFGRGLAASLLFDCGFGAAAAVAVFEIRIVSGLCTSGSAWTFPASTTRGASTFVHAMMW